MQGARGAQGKTTKQRETNLPLQPLTSAPLPLPLCSSAPLPPFTSAPLPLRSSSVATDFRDEDAGNNQAAPQPLLRAKSLPQ